MKPLAEVALKLNKNVDQIIIKLKDKGIEATKSESIKDLAKKHKRPAKEIYTLIVE